MLFLKLVGWVSGIIGLMLLLTPNMLLKANNVINKILMDVDSKVYKLRLGIGISLCLVSATMFFIVYYMAVKFGMK